MLIFTTLGHNLQHTQRQHITYPRHHFWLSKSPELQNARSWRGRPGKEHYMLAGFLSFSLGVLFLSLDGSMLCEPLIWACTMVLELKRTSSKFSVMQEAEKSTRSDIVLTSTWSSNTATHVADVNTCVSTITVSRCPILVLVEKSPFFVFLKACQSHTEYILGIYLLTCWLHGTNGIWGR